jgi:hypothetical protein
MFATWASLWILETFASLLKHRRWVDFRPPTSLHSGFKKDRPGPYLWKRRLSSAVMRINTPPTSVIATHTTAHVVETLTPPH